jgi:hypothetical protein
MAKKKKKKKKKDRKHGKNRKGDKKGGKGRKRKKGKKQKKAGKVRKRAGAGESARSGGAAKREKDGRRTRRTSANRAPSRRSPARAPTAGRARPGRGRPAAASREPWVVRHVSARTAIANRAVAPRSEVPPARDAAGRGPEPAPGAEQNRARRIAGLFAIPQRYLDVVQFRLEVVVLDESGIPSHNPVLARSDGSQVCWLNLGPVDRVLTFDEWPFEGEARSIVVGAHAYSASQAPDLTRLGRASSAYEITPTPESGAGGADIPSPEVTVED